MMPEAFRSKLVVLVIVNALAVMAWEKAVIVGPVGRWVRSRFRQTKKLNL